MSPALGAVLFVAGLLLLLQPVHDMLQAVMGRDLGEGWGTLLGATLGAIAIAYQARQGFRQVQVAQTRQSDLDRQARIDQWIIEERKRKEKDADDARALAGALRGELVALYHHIDRYKETTSLAARFYGALGDVKGVNVEAEMPRPQFRCLVYESTVSQLGSLGASLAGDVSRVFSALAAWGNGPFEPKTWDAALLAPMHEMAASGAVEFQKDILHVALRLRAFEEGTEDPGTLYEEHLRRRSAATQEMPV